MAKEISAVQQRTLGADMIYDTRDFFGALRRMQVTPHAEEARTWQNVRGVTGCCWPKVI